MALTANSTIAEIMKQPGAQALFEKHVGRAVDPGQLQMAMGMTLQQVAGFIGWNKDKVEALLKDLNT